MRIDRRRCLSLSMTAALLLLALSAIWLRLWFLAAIGAFAGGAVGAILGAIRDPGVADGTTRRRRILDTSIGGTILGAGTASLAGIVLGHLILASIHLELGAEVLIAHQILSPLATERPDNETRAARAQVIPMLIDELGDTKRSAQERATAAYRLAQFPDDAKTIVPALIEALKSDETMVRIAASHALGFFGAAAGEAVPELMEALSDEALPVRLRLIIVDALGAIGPAAQPAVPMINKLIDNIEQPGTGSATWVSDTEKAKARAALESITANR